MLTTFVLNYAHQLNHPNPLTRASARWGLMCALWRFSPDMPCVLRGLADCDCTPRTTIVSSGTPGSSTSGCGLSRRAIPWRCPSTPWERQAPPAKWTMPTRPWRPATGTGQAPAERGGHHVFVDRKLSPRGPDTCGGPGSCTLRALPCGTYCTRRFSYKTPLGTPTTRPVEA